MIDMTWFERREIDRTLKRLTHDEMALEKGFKRPYSLATVEEIHEARRGLYAERAALTEERA